MSQIKFQPLRDWVVFNIPNIEKTDSGIIVPDQAKPSMTSNIVEVLAAGPDCKMVKEGDTVLVHPESPALVINVHSKEYACVNEFQVVGIVE
uniref:Co-chaperonin GroES n=1 Tax=uncultured virus TaxID=340016 RepID=A0A221S438_9VIRU|nr:co-chaperonin GroES [uncultured virus]ASN63603.1 co-chaperonin GroES [uncultured virus]